MKKIFTFLIASLFSSYAMSQQPQFEWAKSIGGTSSDGGYSIALDNSGNVFTAGYFMDTVVINPGPDSVRLISVGGSADILISKFDPDGNFLWAKGMGGPGSDGSYSCGLDSDGNVYLTGYFMDTVDFDPGPGVFELMSVYYFDMFICKFNSSGDFLWAKQVGGSGDYDMGQNIILDPADGSILITGSFGGTCDFDPGQGIFELSAGGFSDIYALKLDADGNFIWAGQLGGDGFDAGMGISLNDKGDIFICGEFEGTGDFDPGTGTYFMTSAGYADGFVCKLASDGRLSWAVQMGSVGDDWANSLDIDPTGNVLITGEFLWDVDFDPGEGDYTLTSQNWDAFLWKLDTDGKLIWARRVGGPDFDWGNYITVDDFGNAYTTGFFMTTADFDPGEEVFELTAGAYWEVYVSKLTEAGNFEWAVSFVGNVYYDVNINQGWCLAVDGDNNVYSTGVFESWTDVDPGPEIFYLTAYDSGNGWYSEDAFIHKMSQESVGFHENSINNQFSLYPNPAKDMVTINLGSEFNDVEVNVIDITGKILATSSYNNTSSFQLNLDLEKGAYIIRVRDKQGMNAYFKVIKE